MLQGIRAHTPSALRAPGVPGLAVANPLSIIALIAALQGKSLRSTGLIYASPPTGSNRSVERHGGPGMNLLGNPVALATFDNFWQLPINKCSK
jgi:hypothetical protein